MIDPSGLLALPEPVSPARLIEAVRSLSESGDAIVSQPNGDNAGFYQFNTVGAVTYPITLGRISSDLSLELKPLRRPGAMTDIEEAIRLLTGLGYTVAPPDAKDGAAP